MDPVTIEFATVANPRSIKISWTPPYDNSELVTAYDIRIYGYPGLSTGSFTSRDYFATPECNGGSEPAFLSLHCYVPLSTLRREPFMLQPGQAITVIARASNLYGWGEYSEWNLYTPADPPRVQIPP